MTDHPRLTALMPIGILLCITVVWGWTFLVVKDAIASYPPLLFLALRFALAAVLLAPFGLRKLQGSTIMTGLLCGSALTIGYLFQTLGLQSTSAANAGLLTGLFVVFTPIVGWLLFSVRMPLVTVLSIVGAAVGTAMLTAGGLHGLHFGDALELLTAVAFAVHIVLLGSYAGGHRSSQLAFAQMALAAVVFSSAGSAVRHGSWPLPSLSVWVAITVTGAFASALAFWGQTFVQQRISPARTAIILVAEPAFAAAFAVWLGGERLDAVQGLGAVLILATLVFHEATQGGRPLPMTKPGVPVEKCEGTETAEGDAE